MESTKLICPACSAKIQTTRQLPVGAKGRCPRCQTVFVVPEPEEITDSGAAPQLVDDEAGDYGDDRPRRKKRKAKSSGGLMSYLALLIAGALVLGFVVFMVWLFYYYAFPSSQQQDYIPTLPAHSPQTPSGTASQPAR
ncbi:MAG: hypothetical protein C5B58_02940 [Acidobacteria bacterium]|nr:MAG: hypothetical protein C5B58_02940 [Acidobacteriota bacterium]